MKLNILRTLGLLATSMVLTGCYEDKGNYDYTEIEELTITLPSAIEAMANAENIQFSPTIVSSTTGKEISPDDPNYEYECRVYYTRTIDGISEKWYDINPDKTMAVDFFCRGSGRNIHPLVYRKKQADRRGVACQRLNPSHQFSL